MDIESILSHLFPDHNNDDRLKNLVVNTSKNRKSTLNERKQEFNKHVSNEKEELEKVDESEKIPDITSSPNYDTTTTQPYIDQELLFTTASCNKNVNNKEDESENNIACNDISSNTNNHEIYLRFRIGKITDIVSLANLYNKPKQKESNKNCQDLERKEKHQKDYDDTNVNNDEVNQTKRRRKDHLQHNHSNECDSSDVNCNSSCRGSSKDEEPLDTSHNSNNHEIGQPSDIELMLASGFGDETNPPAFHVIVAELISLTVSGSNKPSDQNLKQEKQMNNNDAPKQIPNTNTHLIDENVANDSTSDKINSSEGSPLPGANQSVMQTKDDISNHTVENELKLGLDVENLHDNHHIESEQNTTTCSNEPPSDTNQVLGMVGASILTIDWDASRGIRTLRIELCKVDEEKVQLLLCNPFISRIHPHHQSDCDTNDDDESENKRSNVSPKEQICCGSTASSTVAHKCNTCDYWSNLIRRRLLLRLSALGLATKCGEMVFADDENCDIHTLIQ